MNADDERDNLREQADIEEADRDFWGLDPDGFDFEDPDSPHFIAPITNTAEAAAAFAWAGGGECRSADLPQGWKR